MPIRIKSKGSAAPAPAPPPLTASDTSTSDKVTGGLAALAAGGAGYALLKNPNAASRLVQGALDLRKTSMLSGLATLKSLLGNVGGTAYASLERGSMEPLRQLFSSQTLRDAGAAFKRGANYAETAGEQPTIISKLNLPGRIMGAMDEASQGALRRAGMSAEEAQKTMLQTPLPPGVASRLSGPVGEYLVPFRRTPFNQFLEGVETLNPKNVRQGAALATALGTGYATGTQAEDPRTIALGTASSGRYGLPYAAGAAVGRLVKTGSKRSASEAIQGMSPVSEYSVSQGVLGPFTGNPGLTPAAVPAWQYVKSLLGIK